MSIHWQRVPSRHDGLEMNPHRRSTICFAMASFGRSWFISLPAKPQTAAETVPLTAATQIGRTTLSVIRLQPRRCKAMQSLEACHRAITERCHETSRSAAAAAMDGMFPGSRSLGGRNIAVQTASDLAIDIGKTTRFRIRKVSTAPAPREPACGTLPKRNPDPGVDSAPKGKVYREVRRQECVLGS